MEIGRSCLVCVIWCCWVQYTLASVNANIEGTDPACVWQNRTVCSDRGTCESGKCVCFTRPNPVEEIYGDQCQCDNFACERFRGSICGGPDRGVCACNNVTGLNYCQCKDGLVGDSCECATDTTACLSVDGHICNNAGVCECGSCRCNVSTRYRGPTCEHCPGCPSECELLQPCVQCKAYRTGPYMNDPAACDRCPYEVEVYETLPQPRNSTLCMFRDEDNCNYQFTYRKLQEGNIELQAVEKPTCSSTDNGNNAASGRFVPGIAGIVIIPTLLLLSSIGIDC